MKTKDQYGYLFDPECVKYFNEIIEKTDAKIVVSSTWRLKGIKWLKECFKFRCINGEIIDTTPISTIDDLFNCRGQEIESWLSNNGFPDKIAIIDDGKLGFGYDEWKTFFKTKTSVGITEDIKNNIIKHLNE